jgi:hypothetical protein
MTNNEGYFGYKIGKKQRMMYIDDDGDLLWGILVREIYILMKHYGSIEMMKNEFEKVDIINNKKKINKSQLDKCKYYTDYTITEDGEKKMDWTKILKYCKSSFINILDCGYILNTKQENGYIFILDFNNSTVNFYLKKNNKTNKINCATIDEILNFDDMPTKTYTIIMNEMKSDFDKYYKNLKYIYEEMDKINNIINETKKQSNINIESKATRLLESLKWEEKKLHIERRVFYDRLKSLDMIEE